MGEVKNVCSAILLGQVLMGAGGCQFLILALIIAVMVMESVFFFKQKTAYEMRISDWSSDVCSSDLCCVSCKVKAQRSGSAASPLNAPGSSASGHCQVSAMRKLPCASGSISSAAGLPVRSASALAERR